MEYCVRPSALSGEVRIPGSKSHTIRALVFAMLAGGESVISDALESADTGSCLDMIQAFGAEFTADKGLWKIRGTGGKPRVPEDVIDTGNSGTSLYLGMGIASLISGRTVFTGDAQIRSRPAAALLEALSLLGAEAFSTRGNGKPPLVIGGPVRGGRTSVEAVSSQYLSSLLIAAPFARGGTDIDVPLLYEKPYVDMTLGWLDRLGLKYANENYRKFHVPGNQSCSSFALSIPADFSSAAFFLTAAAITGSEVTLRGLDYKDSQGDKHYVDILKQMGADIEIAENSIKVRGGVLRGGVFDLNSMPDALPALSVAACFAGGRTEIVNVPQARLKETDRIHVMKTELASMGADIMERDDGLIITGSRLRGRALNGHSDHRVVMALCAAGLAAEGETSVSTAESAAVTFPDFYELMKSLGADIKIKNKIEKKYAADKIWKK